jgi:hypothetical protein
MRRQTITQEALMSVYFDLDSIDDETTSYLSIPKVWLLDYAPRIISTITSDSFFDIECAYLKMSPDGDSFMDTLWDMPEVEAYIRETTFIQKFTEHCLEHKIPFSLSGFLSYDWSLFENYHFKCYQWKIRTNKKPKPLNGIDFF